MKNRGLCCLFPRRKRQQSTRVVAVALGEGAIVYQNMHRLASVSGIGRLTHPWSLRKDRLTERPASRAQMTRPQTQQRACPARPIRTTA